MDAVLKLDELMLEVGVGLVPLVDAKQGGQLLSRVKSLRKNLAQQLGFLAPSIHITDNLSLREREYVVYLRGTEIARWELRRDRLLAVNSNPKPGDIPGQETREPAFNSPAKVDYARPSGAGHHGRLCRGRPHIGAGGSSCRNYQAKCAATCSPARRPSASSIASRTRIRSSWKSWFRNS